jgi:hypothetical protein
MTLTELNAMAAAALISGSECASFIATILSVGSPRSKIEQLFSIPSNRTVKTRPYPAQDTPLISALLAYLAAHMVLHHREQDRHQDQHTNRRDDHHAEDWGGGRFHRLRADSDLPESWSQTHHCDSRRLRPQALRGAFNARLFDVLIISMPLRIADPSILLRT